MSNPFNIVLAPQRRGAEFRYSFTLGGDWVVGNFDGGMLWTLRTKIPKTARADDTDTIENGGTVVHQASLADRLIFTSPTEATVLIPGSFTKTWPLRKLFWDLQGKIVLGSRVLDLGAGTIIITGDVTQS